MDLETLKQAKDLGIAIVAVLSFAIILWQVIKANKDVLSRTLDAHEKNQTWFLDYVNENNHQKSDMIKEHTEVMVKVGNAVAENTKSTEVYNKTLERLIDKL